MFSTFAWRIRAILRLSPPLATALLTAAIFLLPATGDRRPARASVDDIQFSATHISRDKTRPEDPSARN